MILGLSNSLGGTYVNAPLAAEIAAYQTATGITDSAARKLNTMLSQIRAAGAEPSIMWVGGSDYNNVAQTAAIIGGDATLVGAKANVPAAGGSNFCRFNLSKFLRWDNPPALKGTAVSSLVLMVWYESMTDVDFVNIAHAYTNTTRGPLLQGVASGGQVFRNLGVYPSAAGAVLNIRNNPGSASDFMLGLRVLVAHLKPGSSATRALLDGQDYPFSPTAVYNDGPYFYVGGLDPTSTSSTFLANAKVYAVVLADTLTESRQGRMQAANAPFTSSFMEASTTPLVVTMGDSTTQSKWPGQVAGTVNGGAWYRGVAWEDLAQGSTSLDYAVAQTSNILAALSARAWGERYFYYAPEIMEPTAAAALGIPATQDAWIERTQEFIEDIEARSGAQIVLGSYIKGNEGAGDTFGVTPYNDYFEALCTERGWVHVPFYDDPHSQVWTGAFPGTYGWYGDNIHQTTAGTITQAEIWAAVFPHPVNTSAPRAVYGSPPVVTGTLTSGSLLSCTTGSWLNSPTSYTYQWYANMTAIGGATASTYTLTGTEVGKRVACRVTAVKTGQNSASFTSAPTAAIS